MRRQRLAEQLASEAARLARDNPAFTRKNLFHAVRRAVASAGESLDLDYRSFCDGPLADRLRSGPLPALLPVTTSRRDRRARLPREWDAYFPACILVVDRAELIPLFVASGVLVQARMAIVSLDGRPAPVVSWLCRGLRAGHRAPIGYLHDASTVVYPFASPVLATWAEVRSRREEPDYRDLGLPVGGLAPELFGVGGGPILEVEEPPPHAMIAHVARALLAMLPPDPMLSPLVPRRRELRRSEVSHDRPT